MTLMTHRGQPNHPGQICMKSECMSIQLCKRIDTDLAEVFLCDSDFSGMSNLSLCNCITTI